MMAFSSFLLLSFVVLFSLFDLQFYVDGQATGSWSVASGGTGTVAIHSILLPYTNRLLFFERPEIPSNPNTGGKLSAVYDTTSYTYTALAVARDPFCAVQNYLPNGQVVVLGGDNDDGTAGLIALRLFDPNSQTWNDVGDITSARWYPTTTRLPDGRLATFGGSFDDWDGGVYNVNPSYEFLPPLPSGIGGYSPLLVANNLYPFSFLLPDGDLYMYVATQAYFFNPNTQVVGTRGVTAHSVYRQYPSTGSAVLLPLSPLNQYNATVVQFGGSTATATPSTPSSNNNAALNIPSGETVWEDDTMPHHRVMPDSVLLPDGTVLVVNGGTTGIAGGPAGTYQASGPVFPADLYTPTNPLGSRWSVLASATVPRFYHSIAVLLPDGRVLTAGCDQGITSPTAPYEYRAEIFSPPYITSPPASRPTITFCPAIITYGLSFRVGYTGTVTAASLIAPSATTHSFNFNQRFVWLTVSSAVSNFASLVAPPNQLIAPPGPYMLFLLNAGAPSTSCWIRLSDTALPTPTYSLGLVAAWAFDEGTGSSSPDLSANKNTATLASAGWSTIGVSGTALYVTGVSASHAYGSDAGLPATTTARTISAWFKLYSLATNMNIFSYGAGVSSEAQGISTYVTPGVGITYFGWNNDVTFNYALVNDTWYHVAATYDGSTAILYINGVPVASASKSWYTVKTGNFFIGELVQNGGYPLNGVIDEVLVYNQVLSESNILALAQTTHQIGLVGWWKLNEGTGSVVTDSTEYGNNAPIVGATWATSRGGNVLNFNGINNYVQLTPVNLPTGTTPRTMAVWFKLNALPVVGGSHTLLWYGNSVTSQGSGIGLHNLLGTKYLTIRYFGFNNDIDKQYPIVPNVWYHVATTYKDSLATIFVNGVPITSVGISWSTAGGPNFFFGALSSTVYLLNGQLSDVRIYNRALSPAEIKGIIAPFDHLGLVLWLKADAGVFADSHGDVSVWMDQSGNGNDAFVTNFNLSHPLLVQNSIGANSELPVVRFFGNFLQTTNNLPGGSGPYSIFTVIRPAVVGVPCCDIAAGIIDWGVSGVNNEHMALRLSSVGVKNYWWGNDLECAVALSPNVPVLISVTFDGITRSMYINGSPACSDTPTGKNTDSTPAIIGYTGFQEYFRGDIVEILVFDMGINPAGGQIAVQQYMRGKYDLW